MQPQPIPREPIRDVGESGYQPVSLHSFVYEKLRNGLIDGRFAPGETLSLRTLADALGTSPMPVRDAVRRLTTEGALEMRSNRSVAVPVMTRKQFENLTELRLELEGEATERSVRNGSQALLPELIDIESRSQSARKGPNAEQFSARLSLNRKFHFTLYQHCGNSLRMRMIELLWLQSASFTHLSLSGFNPHLPGQHHRKIIEAVRTNDYSAARSALEDDIKETFNHLLTIFEFPA